MKKLYFIICMLLPAPAIGQTLTVLDQTTLQPIANVTLHASSPAASAHTNAKGQVNISAFKGADSIYFSHINYLKATYSYKQLEGMRFMLGLTATNVTLDEIVIAANRWEQDESGIPYQVDKIDKREIDFQNPQTTADVLSATGSVYVQKSQMAGGSPMLRGFATNRVMLVVDGVRMNNAIFRAGNLQNVISIDANALESTEVLFGPGAVMYGSDAIGGVMDFHTLKPSFADSSILFNGAVFGRYSTANKEKTGHAHLNIGLKKWAFVSSFTYADYDDLRAGSKGNAYFLRPYYQQTINGADTQIVNPDPQMQVRSGFSQMNAMQKIAFRSNEKWSIGYDFHYSTTSDAPRYDRLTLDADGDSALDFAEWYYGPQRWMMNRLAITHSDSNRLYNQLRIIAATQKYEESRHDRRFGNKRIRHQYETVDAYSLNIDLDKRLGKKISLFYGAEGVYNLVGSQAHRTHIETGAETPTNTRYPDGSTWQVYGAYVNMKYGHGLKWTFNAGARYSYYMIEAGFDTTLFPFPFTKAENKNGAVNGGLGAVFKPNDKLQLYANASTGFRAPNIDDIGKVFESEPGSVVVPNTGLKPEYAYSAELGAAKVFRDFMKLDMSVYYTLLDDALARRNFEYNGEDSIMYDGELSQVQAIQNITKAHVYGVQTGIEIYFGKGIALSSTITWQKGEEQSGDSLVYYPLRHVPPMFGSTHLAWKRKKLWLDLYSDYNSGMSYEDLALSERSDDAPYAKDANGLPFVPGWYTINFKAAWFVNRHLTLNAGVENIEDKLYRTYASGISAPGRNFIVTLRGNF